MKTLIQRVSRASVTIDGKETAAIGRGLLVFFCVERTDIEADADRMAARICAMRIFPDENHAMNIALNETDADIMIVSQFTLCADTSRGNRPSFGRAAGRQQAEPIYQRFCDQVEYIIGKKPQTGRFGADMQVELVNDGPVTIFVE